MKRAITYIFLSFSLYLSVAQNYSISGRVYKADSSAVGEPAVILIDAKSMQLRTDATGYFNFDMPLGVYTVRVFCVGSDLVVKRINVNSDQIINFYLPEIVENLEEVSVQASRDKSFGIKRLGAVEGFGIYEAKKNEIIQLDDFAANKVNNNARQVFAKVPGLNIWESDFAGLQLDIAARGLGPSRTANFNTRQNGYDMSADALGYPESYYMPSMQAVEKIEIVRGAASLQYGTQFGGMLNFVLKGAAEKPIEVEVEQAIGSFGLINSFASVSGSHKKVDYYSYYQYRQGDGWRPNSGFDSHIAFARLGYKPNDKLKLGIEYSFMDYEAQQPGGLTDDDFENGNLDISRRERNWFQVNWNLIAGTLDYQINEQTKLNLRTFGLYSRREALGNLEQIDRPDDPNQNRTLIRDNFNNFGAELRGLHYFKFLSNTSALLVGGRFYNGLTDRQQGDASPSAEPDFIFLNPDDLEEFDDDFPSRNYSIFSETVLNLTSKWSETPGVRVEYIQTDSEGMWKQTVRDFAGNITAQNVFTEEKSVRRSFALFGLGSSYYLKENLNLYANISQNFRSVTFSDLRLNNPNFVLDSLITDENGYNIDFGIRGAPIDWLNVDISLFYLRYNDRIGVLLPPGSTLLFRTNVGDSRHVGVEAFTELDILSLLKIYSENTRISYFTNFSFINAQYISSQDAAIEGRRVEYVPEYMLRTGLNFSWHDLKLTYQFSFLSEQFSDATNSTFNPNALTGLIPSYNVMDVSVQYTPGRFKFTGGINNLTDQAYFTRRAESYPGPGIIPATPRSFYFSFGVRI